ncbi:MAG: response regulator [Candidatus Woesearchaeota archaeon]
MPGKIIIADDDSTWRNDFVVAISRNHNVEVTQVDDGGPLVKRVLAEDFDIVFTDYDMPFIRGVEANKHTPQ